MGWQYIAREMLNMKHKLFLWLLVVLVIIFSLCIGGCVSSDKAERHFRNAVDFMELQMFPEAIIELKSGMRLAEKEDSFMENPEGELLRAAILVFDNKGDAAIKALEELTQKHKWYWNGYVLLASLYIQEKNYKKALATLEKIPIAEFNYGQTDFVRGLVFFQEAKYGKAIESLRQAKKQFNQSSLKFNKNSGSQQFIISGASLMVSLLLGRAYEENGGYLKALENYMEVENINPNFPGIKEIMTINHGKMDISNGSKNASLYNSIGWEYMVLGQYNEALEYFKKAIDKDPKYSSAYNNLGLAYYRLKNVANAKINLKKAIELSNDKKATMYSLCSLGRIFRESGHYSEALDCFNKVLITNLAYVPAKKEFKIAFTLKLLKEKPKDKCLYEELGDGYIANDEWEEAIKAYNAASQNARVHYKIACVYLQKREYEKTIIEAKKALIIEPKHQQALFVLGTALASEERYAEAIEAFSQSLDNAGQKDKAQIENGLAYIYFKKGDMQTAVKKFKGLSKDEVYGDNSRKIIGVIG